MEASTPISPNGASLNQTCTKDIDLDVQSSIFPAATAKASTEAEIGLHNIESYITQMDPNEYGLYYDSIYRNAWRWRAMMADDSEEIVSLFFLCWLHPFLRCTWSEKLDSFRMFWDISEKIPEEKIRRTPVEYESEFKFHPCLLHPLNRILLGGLIELIREWLNNKESFEPASKELDTSISTTPTLEEDETRAAATASLKT